MADMARPSLSPSQVEATRRRICEAAVRVFERDGTRAATMRTIAREAGCSAAAPYLYFESKGAILARLRADGFDELAARLADAAAPPGPPFDRLAALARAYVRFGLERPEVYRLMFETHQGDGDTDERVRAARESAFGIARELYREAIRAGAETGEPTTLTHLLWLHLHGLVALHLANQLDRGRTLAELTEALVEHHTRRDQEPPLAPYRNGRRRR